MTLKVTTFSSKGRATRLYSYKTKRIHHLQSDNQLNIFLLMEWIDAIIDIKENIELKDWGTMNNIDNLRLDKFTDKKTGELFQLHTNFLIKVLKNGVYEEIAISVKSLSELERKTVIEKLEIERRYWKANNIKLYLITEKEIDKQFVKNIKWVREALISKTIENINEIAENLYYFMENNTQKLVKDTFNQFEEENNLKIGTGLFAFRYLIANKEIEIDMKKDINLNKEIMKIVKF